MPEQGWSKAVWGGAAVAGVAALGIAYKYVQFKNLQKEGLKNLKVKQDRAIASGKPLKKKKKKPKGKAKSQAKISKETVIKVYSGFIQGTQENLQRLMQLETQIANSQPPPSMENIKAYLKRQYNAMKKKVDDIILKSNGTTAQEVEAGVQAYMNDPKVKALYTKYTNQIRGLAQVGLTAMPAGPAITVPATMTAERTLTVFKALMSEMAKAMDQAIMQVKTQVSVTEPKPSPGEVQQMVQNTYLNMTTQAKDKILKDHNVAEEVLDAAIVKYRGQHQFAMEMQSMQIEQKMRWQKLMAEL